MMAKYDGVGHDEHPHHFHAVLATLRPKMPAPHADSTVY